MLRKGVLVFLALTLMMSLSVAAFAQAPAFGTKGPHVDEILLPIIVDTEAQLLAIRRGEVDILPGLARPTDIAILEADPNVDITMDLGFHMFHMAINMRVEPLSDSVVRRAIAHVVDRDEIIFSLFDGYMLPLAEFVPQSSPFFNPEADIAEYDPEMAKAILDAAGYTMGPGGVRINPRTGQPMRKMILMTPTYEEAPTSAELGKIIADAAQAVGIPLEAEPVQFNTIVARILSADRDFDMYLLAWGLNRFPTHLYTLFHSNFDVENANNTVGLNDPVYDALAERVWTPRDLDEAMDAAWEAQEMLAQLQPYVPLYSRPYMDAFRSDRVTGYVPHLGYGAASSASNSIWTPINIRRVGQERGGTVRWLLEQEPGSLNILVGTSAYDQRIFGLVYDVGLIAPEPINNDDYPWMASKWEVGTWVQPDGTEGSKITYWLRDDIYWHDGVPFTANDVKFTMDYLKQHNNGKYRDSWIDYSHIEIIDDHTFTAYYTSVSYWHTYNTRAFLAKHIWENVTDPDRFQPWNEPHPTVQGLTKMIGTGPFVFRQYVPGEFVRVVRNELYFAGLDK